MKILITGATGVVGNSVGRALCASGYELYVVSRSQEKAKAYLEFPANIIECDLQNELLPDSIMSNIDGVVHLMGETIDGRWTEDKKNKILLSRTQSSENLVKSLSKNIKFVISASAQGYYGDTGNNVVFESHTKGAGFLADVCDQWEKPFRNLNCRAVQLRIGLVLDTQSGALKKMISLFQKGLGGVIGSGNQWMSWIALEDLTDFIKTVIEDQRYVGPINVATPHAVTNKQWTKLLCENLDVLQSVPVPAFMLKAILGEMSDLVLSSTCMGVQKMTEYGFSCKYSELSDYFVEQLAPFRGGYGYLKARQFVPEEIGKVFSFFAEAKNLEKITPETLNFKIEKMSDPAIKEQTEILYKLKIHGVPVRWKTLIEKWDPPHVFVDTQLKGPYKYWHHTHSFIPLAGGTLMSDAVRYKLPLGFIGHAVASSFVQSDVENIFRYRREVINKVNF